MASVGDNLTNEPIQLIDFEKNKDGSTTIKLNYATLDKIEGGCGDRPLCTICVCGPSRMGKSFLLGYMIRCLEALEKGETDWMDWNNKTKALRGFKFRSGTAPETQGIWVWSRPFIIKTDEGKEVSVLLIDTQGTQDEFTNTRDMSAIVGLSLLTSSVMIFNFFTNLQEDILVALNTYIQYGLLALENAKDAGPPFQKLSFLIRDWNNPGEFTYGGKGGKQFLEKKLEIKEDQPPEARELRETIRKCFQVLDCFLMPHIGEKALYPDFKGSVSEVAANFSKKLEEFINGLVGEDDVTVKKILGTAVTAIELRSYLEMYVETLNSEDMPTAGNMLQATSKVHNEIQVNNAERKYSNYLKKRMRGKRYLPSDEMETAHKAAEKNALDAFKKMRKFGSPETVEQCRQELGRKIKLRFDDEKVQNEENRKRHISEANNEAMSAFRQELEEAFPLTNENECDYYEDKDLLRANDRAKATVTEEFKEQLIEEGEETVQNFLGCLNRQLDVIFDNIKDKNKVHRGNAERKMTAMVKELVVEYRIKVGDHFSANKFDDHETLVEFHDNIKNAIFESFKAMEKPGGKEFQKAYFEELEKSIDDAFKGIDNSLKLLLNQLWDDALEKLKKESGRYLPDLTAASEDEDCFTPDFLLLFHEREKTPFLEHFMSACSPYPEGSNYCKQLKEKMAEDLDKLYEQVSRKLEDFLRECEQANKIAFDQSKEHYINGMKKVVGEPCSENLVAEHELLQAHDRLLEESLEKYKASPKSGPTNNKEILNEMIGNLTDVLEDLYEKLKSENENRRETALIKAKNLVNECRSDYVREMKVAIDETVRTDDDFTRAHESTKTRAIEALKEQCPVKSPEFIEEYLQLLEEEIEEAFEEFHELYELKKAEDDTKLKGLLVDARQTYLTEMETHIRGDFFVKPDYLDSVHENAKHIVLRKLQSTTVDGLSKIQQEDIINEMNNLYEGFKLRNDIKLNSEKGLGVKPAIGIDLGTTYCCVGVFYQGRVIIIPNLDQGGNLTTPSYVAFKPDGEVIGEPAKEDAYKDPDNTIFDAKRIIGRKMDDEYLQRDMKLWPFTVQEDGGIPKILANGKLFYPEQVSGKLLAYFRTMAEKYLKLEPGTITKAVITVPAYFNDGQRQATVDAGKLAGFEEVLTILNEPTAAAIAYSLERLEKTARKVLIYDLGGGTFDVAILDMKPKNIDVLGVDGDTHLGGEDFDKNMMIYCAQEFKTKYNIDLLEGKDSPDKRKRDDARRRLKRIQIECERAKKQLSTARSASVNRDAIINGLDLDVQISRERFEELNEKEFKETIRIVDRVLKEVKVKKEQIDDIVLVGGSSRILKVQEMLKEYFDGKALNHDIHPDHAVAYGAAIQAAMMNSEQAKGFIDFTKIQDVTPLSLGIELADGRFSKIIPRNTKIPVSIARDKYRTTYHNQTGIKVIVFQGEDPVADKNELLGSFGLSGIPAGPAGKENLQVTMTINSMGILHVEAECLSTKGKNSITITENKQRMSKETIDRLLAESA